MVSVLAGKKACTSPYEGRSASAEGGAGNCECGRKKTNKNMRISHNIHFLDITRDIQEFWMRNTRKSKKRGND